MKNIKNQNFLGKDDFMKIFQNEEDLKDLFDFEYVDTDQFNMTTLRDFSFHKEHNLHIQLKRKVHNCPRCGYQTDLVCDYRKRIFPASNILNKPLKIIYNQRRYFCPSCRKRFIEDNKIVNKYAKIANLTIDQVKSKLTGTITLTDIANENHISVPTVIKILNSLKNIVNKHLSKIISIDEIKFRHKTPKYALVIYDLENNRFLRLVDDRRKPSLEAALSQYSKEERESVEVVVMDLWKPYADIVKKLFPNAKIVADRFHFTRHIGWALRDLRVRLTKECTDKKIYKAFKKNWKIVQTAKNHLNKNCFNYFKNKITSKEEFINDCKKYSKDIKEAIELYNYFLIESKNIKSFDEAIIFLDSWILKLEQTTIPEFYNLMSIFKNWYNEIINAFILKNKNNKSYTNGNIEGYNNKIKVLNRNAYGYSNFERFNIRLSLLA